MAETLEVANGNAKSRRIQRISRNHNGVWRIATMCDAASVGMGNKADSELAEWVKRYCNCDSDSACCEPRNKILIAVVNNGEKQFVRLVVDAYEREEELVCKRNICRLVYDVLSRTEDLFLVDCLVPLLTKCLPVTICTHFAIIGIRALLQRHLKLHRTSKETMVVLQPMYEALLAQNVASMAQQPRIDYLWISHFMLDAYSLTACAKVPNMITRFCDSIAGEKDPRNLLVLFELIPKMCHEQMQAEEVDALATLYTTYYPVQFSPPKNDRIGVKPAELKRRLLLVFKACNKFGPHSMEILIDALYSGYSTREEHVVVLGDTLRFLEECAPVYGPNCYSAHLDSFVEVILSEFFTTASTAAKSENNIVVNEFISMDDDVAPDNLCSADFSVDQANKLGGLYYENWESVSKQLQLWGEILRTYMESINHDMNPGTISGLLRALREQLVADNSKHSEANGHAGYFLDVLCGMERCHMMILEHVLVPLCNDIVLKFVGFKRGEITEVALCNQLALSLPVITNTLFAKLVSRIKHPILTKFANPIVTAALCCIQLNDHRMFKRGIKLLTLAITASKSAILEQVLRHCLKVSQLFSKNVADHTEIYICLYAEALLAMLKCHFAHCHTVIDGLKEMVSNITSAEDIELEVAGYVTRGGDLSREIAEIVATTFEKSNDHQLLDSLFRACWACFKHACDNPDSKIVHTAFLLSLAIIANRDKLKSLVKEHATINQLHVYYKRLGDREKDTGLTHSALQLATDIIPQFMSMVLNQQEATVVARQLCTDGHAIILPIVITEVTDDVLDVITQYSRSHGRLTIEAEAIAWLLQRWACRKSNVDASAHTKVNITEGNGIVVPPVDRVVMNVREGLWCLDKLSSLGVSPMMLSYVLEAMDAETLEAFDMEKYLGALTPPVITGFILRMYPFQQGKLSRTLRYLGFSMKGLTDSRSAYCDLFLLDGTEVDGLPPFFKMQYRFLAAYCARKPVHNATTAKRLIKVLLKMDNGLPVLVAMQALVLSLEDCEIVTEFAEVARLLLQQLVEFQAPDDYKHVWNHQHTYASDKSKMCSERSSSVYGRWLKYEFLIQSQVLLLRIMCHSEQIRVQKPDDLHSFDYRTGAAQGTKGRVKTNVAFHLRGEEWESLVDTAVNTAIGCSLPVCRILGTLIVHCVVKDAPNTVSLTRCKSVSFNCEAYARMCR